MNIIIVDDEPAIRFALAELLGDDGHRVRAAEHAPQALAMLDGDPADLVISDLNMPAMDGLQLLEEILVRHSSTLFVLLTAQGDERTAVRALKLGAFDYVPKPFDNEELRALISRAAELLSLKSENRRLREELAPEFRGMVGTSAGLRSIASLIRKTAPTDITILITGESGTGKELVARAIHEESSRRAEKFIAVNCSAIPAELVESELFGHMRGAFTGADRDRAGVFEAAHKGTLFLDEIGDLAPAAQAKLLRALEERRITRVGGTAEQDVDVRFVAATNRSLEDMVKAGTFREDLLYRLQVMQLTLPPLRERRDDIMALATHFAAFFADRHNVEPKAFSDAARRVLQAYDWPGNIRELRNVIERAVVLSDGDDIAVSDLPAAVTSSTASLRPSDAAIAGLSYIEARDRTLDGFDRSFLNAALERNNGNVSETARTLGLHRQTLQKILRRVGLT